MHGLLHFFRCVEKATETDPSNPEAWQTRARLHIIKSEFKVRRQDGFNRFRVFTHVFYLTFAQVSNDSSKSAQIFQSQ